MLCSLGNGSREWHLLPESRSGAQLIFCPGDLWGSPSVSPTLSILILTTLLTLLTPLLSLSWLFLSDPPYYASLDFMIIPLITPMSIIPTTYYLKISDLGVIESFTYSILIHIYRLLLGLIRGWNQTYNNTDRDHNTLIISILHWAASCSVILPSFPFSAGKLTSYFIWNMKSTR